MMNNLSAASSSAYLSPSVRNLMRRKNRVHSELSPLLGRPADEGGIKTDSILLEDLGRPLQETIVKYKDSQDVSNYDINDALKRESNVFVDRHEIFHPKAIARIKLFNGDVFMSLLNDSKARRLHIKIFDPSNCSHSPYFRQILRKRDLDLLNWAVRSLSERVHVNSGAWKEYASGKNVPLPEETFVYAELPD